jgi:hypothetical protein
MRRIQRTAAAHPLVRRSAAKPSRCSRSPGPALTNHGEPSNRAGAKDRCRSEPEPCGGLLGRALLAFFGGRRRGAGRTRLHVAGSLLLILLLGFVFRLRRFVAHGDHHLWLEVRRASAVLSKMSIRSAACRALVLERAWLLTCHLREFGTGPAAWPWFTPRRCGRLNRRATTRRARPRCPARRMRSGPRRDPD